MTQNNKDNKISDISPNKSAIKGIKFSRENITVLGIITAVFAVLAAFCYAHADSWFCITKWGLDFLSIAKQGNALRFYEIDYVEGGMYNLFIVVVSAIWIFPFHVVMKILGLAPNIYIYNAWYKIVLILALCLSVYYLKKIFELLGFSEDKSKLGAFIYSMCPVVMIGNIAMGQIDILAALFMILGIYNYLKRNKVWMLVFFTISIAFKFFAIMILLPLLLLTDKKICKTIVDTVICCSVAVISEVVSSIDYYYTVGKIDYFGRLFATSFNMISAFVLCAVIVLALCYYFRFDDKDVKFWIMLCLPYFMFIMFVEWNPQWVVYMIPFMVIISLFIENKFITILANLGLGVGFLVHIICVYPTILDNYMVKASLLHEITGKEYAGPAFQQLIGLYYSNVGKAVMVACMILIMLIALLESYGFKVNKDADKDRKALKCDELILSLPAGLFLVLGIILYCAY